MSQSNHAGDQVDLVDFGAVISAIRRNLPWIVIIMGLSVGGAWFYLTRVAVPMYSATSTIVLNTGRNGFADLDPATGGELFQDAAVLNTEVAVLLSSGLLERVVERENLAEDPEFNFYLVDDPAIEATLDPVTVEQRTVSDTIEALRSALSVSSVRGTYIFAITATTTSPAKSQSIANSVAHVYLENQVMLKAEATRNAVVWLHERVEDLQRQLIEAGARIGEFEFSPDAADRFEDSVRLEQLNGEEQAIRDLHQHFLKRLKEAAVQQGLHRPDGRILSRAVLPAEPASPRKRVILLISLMLGGLIALIMIFVRELLSDTILSPVALERITGRPLIGATPRVSRNGRRSKFPGLIGRRAVRHTSALEDLQTSIMMLPSGAGCRTVALCSAVSGEGRTTLTISLAAGLAESGSRVLVIDADLRGGSLTRLAGPKSQAGLVGLCAGTLSFDEALTHSSALNSDLLFCEKEPQKPIDLLASDAFREVMATARKRYDYVLVDTPPILDAPDVRLLGRHMDFLVFLAKWNSTPENTVKAAVSALDRVGLALAGVVMTQIRSSRFRNVRYDVLSGGFAANKWQPVQNTADPVPKSGLADGARTA